MSKRALVLGVTGGQGGAAATALLAAGWRVRGLTRAPASAAAQEAASRGVEIVAGDLDDVDALREAMREVDAVFAVTNWFGVGVEREVLWGKRLAELAVDVGVGHFVYASVICADKDTGVPHFESKGEVERFLAGLPLRTTILRPGIFMEDLTEARYVPAASWGMMPRLVGAKTPVPWVALEQVGAAVARVMGAPERYAGQTVSLIGDVRSMAEARAAFRSRGRWALGLPMPAWLFERLVSPELVAMWRWLGQRGGEWSTTEAGLGMAGLDMAGWLDAAA